MAKKIATNVVGYHEKTGESRWFRKGDTVPAEYQKSITNPAVYEQGDEGDEGEPEAELGDDPTAANQEAAAGEPDEDEDEDDEPDDNYDDQTNDDLRAELANRGLPVHGNKPDLVERLREDDADEA